MFSTVLTWGEHADHVLISLISPSHLSRRSHASLHQLSKELLAQHMLEVDPARRQAVPRQLPPEILATDLCSGIHPDAQASIEGSGACAHAPPRLSSARPKSRSLRLLQAIGLLLGSQEPVRVLLGRWQPLALENPSISVDLEPCRSQTASPERCAADGP